MTIHFSAVLFLSLALPPAPPNPRVGLDVRIAGARVTPTLTDVIWPSRRRVIAAVAQTEEHRFCKPTVAGAEPARGSPVGKDHQPSRDS